jgi:ribosomal subunit interface protein
MRIDVVGRSVPVTDTLRQHAEKRSQKLERYLDMVQQITYTLDQASPSKQIFSVELVVDVEHHPNFVAKAEGTDLYGVIDQATDKAARQLHDFKEKLKLEKR